MVKWKKAHNWESGPLGSSPQLIHCMTLSKSISSEPPCPQSVQLRVELAELEFLSSCVVLQFEDGKVGGQEYFTGKKATQGITSRPELLV